MLEICVLGTGAMMPLPERKLASMLLRRNGRLLLIDCGEGVQVAVRQCGWSLARVDALYLTHYHADHVAGLPGLLLTMGSCGREEPVTIAGPAGLEHVVGCLRVIAPDLPFQLRYETLAAQEKHMRFSDIDVTAFALNHRGPCYGFVFNLNRPGKFDPLRAAALKIPVNRWRALQAGETVVSEGAVYLPGDVLGPPRKGLKLVYCTDTRPLGIIAEMARDADLMICEGTYGEDDKAEKAAAHGHMTFSQAARMAKLADAKELLLTHFSPSVRCPEDHIDAAKKVFPNTKWARDLMFRTLMFKEK